jgi:hypothetical protein
MNRTIRTATLSLILILLTACASAPKVAFRPEVRETIKRVALIDIPEPSQYFFYPGQSTAVMPLMLFGAVGGAVAGGIEVKRQSDATKKFTNAVAPLKPELTSTLNDKLEEKLCEKGYSVIRMPPPPKADNGKDYDLTKVEGDFDVIIVPTLTAGYSLQSGKVTPQVRSGISVYSGSGAEILFADTYVYCQSKSGRCVHIIPEQKYVFNSIDDVYKDISIPVEGLRMGAIMIAERAASEM